jgi:hypothetical protein
VLAVLGLLFGMWLVLSNFTLVTGGSTTVSAVLAAVPFAALVHGPRKSDPAPELPEPAVVPGG